MIELLSIFIVYLWFVGTFTTHSTLNHKYSVNNKAMMAACSIMWPVFWPLYVMVSPQNRSS